MATSYTSLLGFALPVTGELDGTWGTTVNDSITELVEDAIAATATASVASGDWTLSTTGSGAANEARCAILIPTGSPGVSRNIIAPSQSKAYIVINQSDAAVVIKGSATTGVTIPTGDEALVAWNGSDFVRINAAIGGSNTQVQYNSSGSLAGSANLTFDGTTLTAANFADSSLTSGRVTYAGASGNLTDSANLTFNGTTLTSTAFSGPLNGTVGATTPSTGVFTQVDITAQGDLRLQDTTGGQYVALQAPGTIATSYTLTLPTDDGTANQVLTTDGSGVLSWTTPATSVSTITFGTTGLTPAVATSGAVSVAGTLVAANGGTGQSSYTIGDILYASTSTALSKLADVATGNALISGGVGVAPSWGKVGLTTHVSGTLPVANGGTGATTLTANNVILGNGTSAVQFVAPGTNGNVLTSNGTTWTSAAAPTQVYPGAGIAVSTGSAWGTSKTSPTGDIVGTSDSQTLTNKTLTDPAIVGTILEDVYTISDGAAFEVDPGNGSIQLITLGASRTPKATNFAAGEAITLMVDDGSAYTLTWTDATWGGSGVVWMTGGGTAPTLNTSGYTTIVLWKVSTQVYGAKVG
jgi:hypothetical protein